MSRGRTPTPTALKLLRGNPGKRPVNKDEPQPTQGAPEAPEHLDAEGRKQWVRWCAELERMRVLTHADREMLAVMCDTWARYIQAKKEVDSSGLLVNSPNGYAIMNPALSIVNKCTAQLRSFAAEFGLTPAARSRITTNGASGANEFADA